MLTQRDSTVNANESSCICVEVYLVRLHHAHVRSSMKSANPSFDPSCYCSSKELWHHCGSARNKGDSLSRQQKHKLTLYCTVRQENPKLNELPRLNYVVNQRRIYERWKSMHSIILPLNFPHCTELRFPNFTFTSKDDPSTNDTIKYNYKFHYRIFWNGIKYMCRIKLLPIHHYFLNLCV